jgi:hypothetical protein
MKTLVFLLVFLYTGTRLQAQEPLSRAEALRQLYQHYDDANKTAQWVCAKDRKTDDPCWEGADATVSIAPLLTAEVNEDGIEKMYLVASAKPADGSYECHVCAPTIGAAVFALNSGQWVLQSKNEVTGFFGTFGLPADIDLVMVGPKLHGIMITNAYGGQGYVESTKTLLLPLAATVNDVWSTKDQQDDRGDDFGLERSLSHRLRYLSSAGIRFRWVGGPENDLRNDYYNIEVVSHRKSVRIDTLWIKQKYWEDTYQFNGSKYLRVSHEQLTKVTHQSVGRPLKKMR